MLQRRSSINERTGVVNMLVIKRDLYWVCDYLHLGLALVVELPEHLNVVDRLGYPVEGVEERYDL